MCIFSNIYLAMFIRKIIDIVGNSKKSFAWYILYWSMISSLLHLVGLRPRVYYTLTNFRERGGNAPLPPPLNTPMHLATLLL